MLQSLGMFSMPNQLSRVITLGVLRARLCVVAKKYTWVIKFRFIIRNLKTKYGNQANGSTPQWLLHTKGKSNHVCHPEICCKFILVYIWFSTPSASAVNDHNSLVCLNIACYSPLIPLKPLQIWDRVLTNR